jgi:hypothetical protein
MCTHPGPAAACRVILAAVLMTGAKRVGPDSFTLCKNCLHRGPAVTKGEVKRLPLLKYSEAARHQLCTTAAARCTRAEASMRFIAQASLDAFMHSMCCVGCKLLPLPAPSQKTPPFSKLLSQQTCL